MTAPSSPEATPRQYPNTYRYRRIVQAKLFIDENFARKIDIGHIAAEASFSKFHFIRLFRMAYGKTPHQYLISVRMARATALLDEGNPVSDACQAVGFESITTFCGLFRKSTGMAPAAYGRSRQARAAQISVAPLQFVPGCYARLFTAAGPYDRSTT